MGRGRAAQFERTASHPALGWSIFGPAVDFLFALQLLAGWVLAIVAAHRFGATFLLKFVRPEWLLRTSLTVFFIVNGVVAGLAALWYRSMARSCESENSATGGSGLDCLNAGNWFAINMALLVWVAAAPVLAAFVTSSFREKRRSARMSRV